MAFMSTSIGPQRLARLVGDFDRSPAYKGLHDKLQELIGDGRIPLGTRLPSERSVTEALGVSRTTVTRAYSDLVASGFAVAQRGSGTFAAVPIDRRKAHDRSLHPLGASAGDDSIDLNCAASAATPGVAAAFERALARLPAYLSGDGYFPSGLPELQALVADSYVARGLPTVPEQIVITTGALSGVAIAARALSLPGDRIMVESPVYSNAVEALRLGGGRLVSSPLADPLGDSGWDLEGIDATLRQTSPRLAYLIPDFQNPTGFLMSEADRARFARALASTRTVAIVDETLQPTAHTHMEMPAPFASFATDAVAIGSASKVFWGGLRVGWIRSPRPLVERIVAARVQLDLGTSLFDQLVVSELLGSTEVRDARREQLRAQRDALVAAVREHLPSWSFRIPEGGMVLWLRMPEGSSTRLASEAERVGVHLVPGPAFTVEGGLDSWVRIPFAKPEVELTEAAHRIAEVWRESASASAPRGTSRVLIT
jgi:DNA-binding transcriptional MocR family regulator